jgi:hypothetical protein
MGQIDCIPRQANPAAEEANPAAAGKLLNEAICKFDTIFLVLNITGTTANFPKTILVPVSREGNLLQ